MRGGIEENFKVPLVQFHGIFLLWHLWYWREKKRMRMRKRAWLIMNLSSLALFLLVLLLPTNTLFLPPPPLKSSTFEAEALVWRTYLRKPQSVSFFFPLPFWGLRVGLAGSLCWP